MVADQVTDTVRETLAHLGFEPLAVDVGGLLARLDAPPARTIPGVLGASKHSVSSAQFLLRRRMMAPPYGLPRNILVSALGYTVARQRGERPARSIKALLRSGHECARSFVRQQGLRRREREVLECLVDPLVGSAAATREVLELSSAIVRQTRTRLRLLFDAAKRGQLERAVLRHAISSEMDRR